MVTEGQLRGELAGTTIRPGFHVLPGQGNALAAETDAGVVLVDASPVRRAPAMMETLRAATDAPLHAICHNGAFCVLPRISHSAISTAEMANEAIPPRAT